MSIKLITGVTFDAVTRKVYDDIYNNDAKKGKHIVIVPDQFALMTEKEVLEYLNLKSSFNIEVLSFSRFAVKVLGNKINKTLNQYTSVMLLKKLAIDNQEKLNCFSAVAKKNGYINELYAAITNIRNSNIKPNEFIKVIPQLSGMLKSKAEDIALLYEEYDKQLVSNYSDIGSCLEQLAGEIHNLEWISGARFYITDFHEISGVKLNIITELMKYGLSVTIGVPYNESAKNLRIQPKNIIDYVRIAAKKFDIAVEHIYAEELLSEEKKLVADRLFGYNLQTDFSGNSLYSIYSAESKEHEIKSVARMIRRDALNGYKYKDIAVICDDVIAIKDVIKREFQNFEIPYFMDVKADFFTNAVCRIFARAVSVIDKNFAKHAVLAFVKEGLFDASGEEKNIFSQFVLKYNINYNRFTEKFNIGLTDDAYATAEKIRLKLMNYLNVLQIPSNDNVEILMNIKRFYSNVFDGNNLQKYLENLRNYKQDLNAEITELCVKKLTSLLDNTQELFDGSQLNNSEVYNILLSTFESVQVSLIPQYVDNVFVGTANKSKLSDIKILYVIGANEGAYPATLGDNSVLNQNDLEKLSDYSIEITPNAKDKYNNEKFFIMQTLLKGKDKVVITYNGSVEKSILVEQLQRILGIVPVKLLSNSSSMGMTESDYAVKIGTYENAKIELMRYYGERFNGVHIADEKVYDYIYTKLTKQNENFIFSPSRALKNVENYNLQWSKTNGKTFAKISAVETFLKCPFKFYVQNILKLKEQYTSEITPVDLGSFVHRILELFFTRVKDFNISNEQIRQLVIEYTEEVFSKGEFLQLQNVLDDLAINKQLIERCVFTIDKLCANQRRSKFEVEKCELKFGFERSELPPLELEKNGKKYYIRGVIDRIDKYQNYVVIIDYKTSSSVDANISNLYNGTRAQLLLYLNAYMEHTDAEALGVMYMALPYKYSDESKDSGYKYYGFLRNLEQGIEALDEQYLTENTFLPIKINKATKEKEACLKEDSVFTKSEFKLITDYAKEVVVQAIEDIEKGYIAPTPISCDYCPYGNICKEFNNTDLQRQLPKVELQREQISQEKL